MKKVIAQGFPELVEFGFTDSRVCVVVCEVSHDFAEIPLSCAGTPTASTTT